MGEAENAGKAVIVRPYVHEVTIHPVCTLIARHKVVAEGLQFISMGLAWM